MDLNLRNVVLPDIIECFIYVKTLELFLFHFDVTQIPLIASELTTHAYVLV